MASANGASKALSQECSIPGSESCQTNAAISATFGNFVSYDLSAAECIGIGDVQRLGDLEVIRAAACDAEIDEVLSSLPRGYETMLSRVFAGPGGDSDCVLLSGGENQRVALARAMMSRDADLIILDEPSSGLDAEAEARIHRTLQEKYGRRTSLLISHRLSTLREAEVIVVLSGGAIIERGTHAELMALGGVYERLFDLQAAGYQAESAGPAGPGACRPVASRPVAADDELFDAVGLGQHG